jgi:hypothetical protein
MKLKDLTKKWTQNWVETVKKVAETRSEALKKMVDEDLVKAKAFISKERKELKRLQREFPKEIKKVKDYLHTQRTDLENLLSKVKKKIPVKASGKKPSSRKGSSAFAKSTRHSTAKKAQKKPVSP